MATDNWLDEVRERWEARTEWSSAVLRASDVERLLAAAEALAELVALHEGSPTQRPSRWETAWERARAALAQGGGDAPGDRPSRAHLPG